ncbi:hypothetical protein ACO0QE_002474 [Hanseniaspora vineae]
MPVRSFRRLRVLGKYSFFGVLVPYTGYALYISLNSNKEITKRQKLYDRNGQDVADPKHSLFEKYTPLKILGRYENPFEEYRIQTLYEFFFNRVVELFETNRGGIPKTSARMEELMPVHKPSWVTQGQIQEDKILHTEVLDQKAVLSEKSGNDDRGGKKNSKETVVRPSKVMDVTWLGQSCTYIIYENRFKVLLDPLFSDFLINEKFGPRRITRLPCPIEDVPVPDMILVSHNHPDHLDEKSLRHFNRKTSRVTSETVTPATPKKPFSAKSSNDITNIHTNDHNLPLWVVPYGMGKYMDSYQISNYQELSWWQSLKLTTELGHSYFVHCTPTMHWSGRNLIDTNESLWCSYLVSTQGSPELALSSSNTNLFFHAGDTGYVHDLFRIIKEKYGRTQLGILPCGQYCPQWHQRPRHISPEEVLKIMKDMECTQVLGVHWGTFLLSGEYFREPKEKLETLAQWEGIDSQNCYCPELGKTTRFEIKEQGETVAEASSEDA